MLHTCQTNSGTYTHTLLHLQKERGFNTTLNLNSMQPLHNPGHRSEPKKKSAGKVQKVLFCTTPRQKKKNEATITISY